VCLWCVCFCNRAALTNVLFLRPNAVVLEISTFGFQRPTYFGLRRLCMCACPCVLVMCVSVCVYVYVVCAWLVCLCVCARADLWLGGCVVFACVCVWRVWTQFPGLRIIFTTFGQTRTERTPVRARSRTFTHRGISPCNPSHLGHSRAYQQTHAYLFFAMWGQTHRTAETTQTKQRANQPNNRTQNNRTTKPPNIYNQPSNNRTTKQPINQTEQPHNS